MSNLEDYDGADDSDDSVAPSNNEEDLPDKEIARGWEETVTSLKERWDKQSASDPKRIALLDSLDDEQILRDLNRRKGPDEKKPTILHDLAEDVDACGFENMQEDCRLQIIKYLLRKRQETRNEWKESQEDPILIVAMRHSNVQYIKLLLDHCREELKELVGDQSVEGRNCLHWAFKEASPVRGKAKPTKLLKVLIGMLCDLIPLAEPDDIAARDNDENTPVHYALDYGLCREGAEFSYGKRIVVPLLLRGDEAFIRKKGNHFNSKDESPYGYFERTKNSWKQNRLVRRRKATGATVAKNPQGMKPGVEPEEIRDALSRGGKSDQLKTVDKIFDQMTDQGKGKKPDSRMTKSAMPQLDKKSMNLPDMSESRRQAQGQPVQSNKETMTGNRTQEIPNASSERSKSKSTSADEIRKTLKLHYIRTRTDIDAKELLYGKAASGKNLLFDAKGLEGQSADSAIRLIERLQVGGFEDALSCVNLPAFSHSQEQASAPVTTQYAVQANRGRKVGARSQGNPHPGSSSLVAVFDKLVAVKVRTIMRLRVDEGKNTPAHTDAAIERAINGEDRFSLSGSSRGPVAVEVWDWRKPDLSIEVLKFAVPDVKHVYLYWSGNETVLTGWACEAGLPFLHQEKSLRFVTVHASPGLESMDRMGRMLDRFKIDIKNRTTPPAAEESDTPLKDKDVKKPKGELVVETITSMDPAVNFNSGPGQDDAASSKLEPQREPHVWVQKLEGFRAALDSVHQVLNWKTPPRERRVKVALIDDGVDLNDLNMYKNYQGNPNADGLSYCPQDSDGMESPWHRSTNGHGTVMANMIVRINPWISLDVMKIHDKGNTIDAETAARAIEAAVARKAHIISMSWTIKKAADTSHNAGALKRLEDAIKKAADDNVLMFCSTADDIQQAGRDSLPYSAATSHIFRIGAALPQGQPDAMSEDAQKINYYFPGNQVAEAQNPRDGAPVHYHSGSSVATALAAGLASLIMHCATVADEGLSRRPGGAGGERDRAAKLKNHDNMRSAFDSIPYHADYQDRKKYLPVWKLFGDFTENITNAKGDEEKIAKLNDLVGKLCHKL